MIIGELLMVAVFQPAYIDLRDKDPLVRKNTAFILKLKKDRDAIPSLVECLNDQVTEVKEECYSALKAITLEEAIPMEYAQWQEWVKKNDYKSLKMSDASIIPKIIGDAIEQIEDSKKQIIETRKDVQESKKEVNDLKEKTKRILMYIVGGAAVITILFVVGVSLLTAYIGSKLKEWREVVKKAEFYLNECSVISTKAESVFAELERLKRESMEEMDRYCSMLQQNLDHRLKTEITNIKQVAETELGQTVSETKKAIEEKLQSLQSYIKSKTEELNNLSKSV